MSVSENIIELKGIKKCFEDGYVAVEDFNLEVKKGEFIGAPEAAEANE